MAGATAVTPKRAAPSQRGWSRFIPILLVLAGIAVLLYPVVGTQLNNRSHRHFAEQYETDVQQLEGHDIEDELTRAREYNTKLGDGVPILDPWLKDVKGPPSSDPYAHYKSQLDLTEAMARVRVPGVGIDLPVYHGTTDDVLAKGVGHLYGTSLPVGGEGTHAVLTSHTALSNATLFDNLHDVTEGDVFYVDVYGETLAYEVDQIKVVLPTEIGDLRPEAGKDQLTLFTCTPYAINTHRLLVRGHRIPYEAGQDTAAPNELTTLQPWMYWMIGGAIAGLVLLLALILLDRRNKATSRPETSDRAAPDRADPGSSDSDDAPDSGVSGPGGASVSDTPGPDDVPDSDTRSDKSSEEFSE